MVFGSLSSSSSRSQLFVVCRCSTVVAVYTHLTFLHFAWYVERTSAGTNRVNQLSSGRYVSS